MAGHLLVIYTYVTQKQTTRRIQTTLFIKYNLKGLIHLVL
jgi:hypothetical protein